jgi:hypothetical protein
MLKHTEIDSMKNIVYDNSVMGYEVYKVEQKRRNLYEVINDTTYKVINDTSLINNTTYEVINDTSLINNTIYEVINDTSLINNVIKIRFERH